MNYIKRNALEVLGAMQEMEKTLADLYGIFSSLWPDIQVWSEMQEQEMGHARNINEMMEILRNNDPVFSVRRQYSPVAVNTVIKGIEENIEKAKRGDLDRKRALFTARDIEQSVLEKSYADFLEVEHVRYKELVRMIKDETFYHNKILKEEIARSGSSGA